MTAADDVLDVGRPRRLHLADHVAQQRLAVLDRAAAEILAIEAHQVEGEERQRLGAVAVDRVLQIGDTRLSALVGHRDLAVENRLVLDTAERRVEGCSKGAGAIEAVTAR